MIVCEVVRSKDRGWCRDWLVVSAVDDLMNEVNNRIEGKGEEGGLLVASLYDTITSSVGKLPIFGQLMEQATSRQLSLPASQTADDGVNDHDQIQADRQGYEANARRQRRLEKERRGQLNMRRRRGGASGCKESRR